MPSVLLAPLLLASLMVPADTLSRSNGGCATILPALPPTQMCEEAPGGIVIAATTPRALKLVELAAQGEERFQRRFGRAVPRYSVIEMDDGKIDKNLDASLKRAGFVWRLPWLSEDAMGNGLKASITRAVTSKAQTMNLDADHTAAMVRSALAQASASVDPAALRAKQAGALPHELGHGWFIHAFWPNAAAANGHYGGPAPDWMDETAAILMEDDAFAKRRREQFETIYRATDAAAKAKLVDLTSFLSDGHPAMPALNLPASARGVQVLTGEEAAQVASAAGGFYLQARMFADYVLDRSGDPAAFRSAAESFARGDTTAQWLARSGRKLRVPQTMLALQQDWERWLASRLPTKTAISVPDAGRR